MTEINLPEDFINRIKEQLGNESEEFLRSFQEPYHKALRIRKSAAPTLNIEGERVEWEPRGIYYVDESYGKSPLHAAGAFYIQEASAMLPVTMLDIKEEDNIGSGLRVLDLCAAPGGKTTQIADYMQGKGILVCNEIIAQRAKILSENIERMGVVNALVISEDPRNLVDRFPRFFDRILVDAPCSGEGMFRKHPEAMEEWSLENVQICADRQDWILDCASQMLAPGGRIVYSTCTFSYEEDEGSVERFLNSHKDFIQLGNSHRIFPHKDKGEGHFSAILVHRDYMERNLDEYKMSTKSPSKQGTKGGLKNPSKDDMKAFDDFCRDVFSNDFRAGLENVKDRIKMFGDKMYLTPEYMPDIHALSVLRPGLHLGTIIKGRFEPAHALSHALNTNEVKNLVNLDKTSTEVTGYLKGMTLNSQVTKGWCLVCVDGWPLGWGKANGGIVKNHYPKGLRIMC